MREGKLSIVLPAYNEKEMIQKTEATIASLLESHGIDYELVFVDDGSKDNTWQLIEGLCEKNSRVVGVHFSRNFGKESAVFAGLETATGDCVVVMDCDLQHPPQTVLEMYQLWQEGYEVVEGVKRSRGKESIFYKMSAGLFYQIMSSATKIDMSRASDFKLMDRAAVEAVLAMPERNAFFRALSSWVGFKSTSVEFDVQAREAGESKWSSWSLIKYALKNITSFSAMPMQLVTVLGMIFTLGAIGVAIQTLIKYMTGNALEGFTTVILLQLIIGAILMMSLGIIGIYIAKIYDEVKQRPKYIISKIQKKQD